MTVAMHCNLWPPDVISVVLGFNYEAHNAPAYKFNSSATSFGSDNPNFYPGTDILAIGGHMPVFWPCFHCACAETGISELPIKILTLLLDAKPNEHIPEQVG